MESEELERLDEYLVWSLVWYLGIPSDCKFGLGERAFFFFFSLFFSMSLYYHFQCSVADELEYTSCIRGVGCFIYLVAQYTLLPNLDSYFAIVETQALLALSLIHCSKR